MVDPDTYDKYSIPLERQMMKLGRIGLGFHSALQNAQTEGADSAFLDSAFRLEQELTGAPGDAALEVYRDLQKNIKSTKSFIEEYSHLKHPIYRRVLDEASNTYDGLVKLQQLVDQTPPEVMDDIKKTIGMTRGLTKGCFVATAVYGDVNAPELQVLRDFKDNVLMETGLGRKAIDLYYSGFGERTANFVRNHLPSTIPFIRKGLDYVVQHYSHKNK